ncbi:hypothetical protein Hdeb2414_s0435g00893091 [Helianthus debilis subsp. tardiflorus]
MPRWAGAPRENFFYVIFRRKSRPHPVEFFVRTPWNFSVAPLGIFHPHPWVKNIMDLYYNFFSKV